VVVHKVDLNQDSSGRYPLDHRLDREDTPLLVEHNMHLFDQYIRSKKGLDR